jgi:hypothetical protein
MDKSSAKSSKDGGKPSHQTTVEIPLDSLVLFISHLTTRLLKYFFPAIQDKVSITIKKDGVVVNESPSSSSPRDASVSISLTVQDGPPLPGLPPLPPLPPIPPLPPFDSFQPGTRQRPNRPQSSRSPVRPASNPATPRTEDTAPTNSFQPSAPPAEAFDDVPPAFTDRTCVICMDSPVSEDKFTR